MKNTMPVKITTVQQAATLDLTQVNCHNRRNLTKKPIQNAYKLK